MNNVGGLALLMPAALQLAKRLEAPPSQLLMRLAFATILGGMPTLIGTPPNLIVSGFMKASEVGQDFAMFDFTPVGGAVAVSGLAFMALIGWGWCRAVPAPTRPTSTPPLPDRGRGAGRQQGHWPQHGRDPGAAR